LLTIISIKRFVLDRVHMVMLHMPGHGPQSGVSIA
jgi:hypothetical protein